MEKEKVSRLNREKKIENSKLKIKIGTTNNDNPKAIYIECSTFINPLYEEDDYEYELHEIERELGLSVKRFIKNCPILDSRHILAFEAAPNGMSVKKKSYVFFQITLKQNNEPPFPLKKVKEEIESDIIDVMRDFIDSLEKRGFAISKTKR